MNIHTYIRKFIPEQKKGARTGAISKRILNSRDEAIHLFQTASSKLKNINYWQQESQCDSEYVLMDTEGNFIQNREPELNDMIRITIPGPENTIGQGYDWVQIKKIFLENDRVRDMEISGFTVQPVSSPVTSDKQIAHFYMPSSSSSFLILRKKRTVYAIEKGLNEIPNITVNHFSNKLRNLMVSIIAMIGGGHSNWKKLTDALLR